MRNMRGNKYHAIRTGTSASRKEARRKQELELMQRAGKISDLRCQVPFELIPAQREPPTIGPRGGVKPGKLIEHNCVYIADFVYVQDGQTIVEDTKGFRTKDYVIKRKLMLKVFGIRIREV